MLQKKKAPDFHRSQGIHNMDTSRFLLDASAAGSMVCWDWVVTTAYYSAMHHALHAIEGAKSIRHFACSDPLPTGNFDEAVRFIRDKNRCSPGVKTDKHSIIYDILRNNVPEKHERIASIFKKLQDDASTARYRQFLGCNRKSAEGSVECAKEIVSFLDRHGLQGKKKKP